MRKRVLYTAGPQWAAMAERLGELMRGGGFRTLKDEARTRAGLLSGPDGAPVFVKLVRTESWTRGLVAAARGSRVRRWLRGAAMLGAAGFNRPVPLAALEVRRAGAVRESYLVCAALGEASVLSRVVLGDGTVDLRRRRSLLGAVAREVRRLHDAGLYTRDLQETNLMVEGRAGATPRIWFVDLEDFRRVRAVSWRRRLLNLVHLDRSLGRFLTRPARLRFLHDYLDGDARERAARRRIVAQLWRQRSRVEHRHRGRAPRDAEPSAAAAAGRHAGGPGAHGAAAFAASKAGPTDD